MPENYTEGNLSRLVAQRCSCAREAPAIPCWCSMALAAAAAGSATSMPWQNALPCTCLPTPGSNESERPEWMETMHDMACFYNWFVESQDIQGCRAMGFSMGGWLASEMVAAAGPVFSKLMLVSSVGIRPNEGEIADVFIITPAQVIDLLFHDPSQAPEYDQVFGHAPTPEQVAVLERNREMSVRICWKPYMHDLSLAHRLARVNIPTRIVLGPRTTGWLRWNAATFSSRPSPAPTW